MDTFGEKVRKIRKENNLTQQQLADKLFATPQAISKWEHDQGMPSLDKITDMAKIFSVDINYFLGDEIEKDKRQDQKKWWLLGLNAMYYLVTLIVMYTFSSKINHDFFGMVVSTIIYFVIFTSLVVFFHKHQLKPFYGYVLGFVFLDLIWLICVAALFIAR